MGDDNKQSWRDRDLARDRGIKISKSVSKAEERENKTATLEAKKQLNSLFANSKLSKDKEAKIQAIQALRGKPTYYEKMTDYIKDYGVPVEWDAQLFFLDHRDSAIVVQVLEELKRTAPKESLTKQELLGQKLKVMALSSFDPRILDKIKELQGVIINSNA